MNKGLIFYTKKIRRLSDAYNSFISVLAEHFLSITRMSEQRRLHNWRFGQV